MGNSNSHISTLASLRVDDPSYRQTLLRVFTSVADVPASKSQPEPMLTKHRFMKVFPQLATRETFGRDFFSLFDLDESGAISFDEFVMGFIPFSVSQIELKIDAFFRNLDMDNDGRLSYDELVRICRNVVSHSYVSTAPSLLKKPSIDRTTSPSLSISSTRNSLTKSADEYEPSITRVSRTHGLDSELEQMSEEPLTPEDIDEHVDDMIRHALEHYGVYERQSSFSGTLPLPASPFPNDVSQKSLNQSQFRAWAATQPVILDAILRIFSLDPIATLCDDTVSQYKANLQKEVRSRFPMDQNELDTCHKELSAFWMHVLLARVQLYVIAQERANSQSETSISGSPNFGSPTPDILPLSSAKDKDKDTRGLFGFFKGSKKSPTEDIGNSQLLQSLPQVPTSTRSRSNSGMGSPGFGEGEDLSQNLSPGKSRSRSTSFSDYQSRSERLSNFGFGGTGGVQSFALQKVASVQTTETKNLIAAMTLELLAPVLDLYQIGAANLIDTPYLDRRRILKESQRLLSSEIVLPSFGPSTSTSINAALFYIRFKSIDEIGAQNRAESWKACTEVLRTVLSSALSSLSTKNVVFSGLRDTSKNLISTPSQTLPPAPLKAAPIATTLTSSSRPDSGRYVSKSSNFDSDDSENSEVELEREKEKEKQNHELGKMVKKQTLYEPKSGVKSISKSDQVLTEPTHLFSPKPLTSEGLSAVPDPIEGLRSEISPAYTRLNAFLRALSRELETKYFSSDTLAIGPARAAALQVFYTANNVVKLGGSKSFKIELKGDISSVNIYSALCDCLCQDLNTCFNTTVLTVSAGLNARIAVLLRESEKDKAEATAKITKYEEEKEKRNAHIKRLEATQAIHDERVSQLEEVITLKQEELEKAKKENQKLDTALKKEALLRETAVMSYTEESVTAHKSLRNYEESLYEASQTNTELKQKVDKQAQELMRLRAKGGSATTNGCCVIC